MISGFGFIETPHDLCLHMFFLQGRFGKASAAVSGLATDASARATAPGSFVH